MAPSITKLTILVPVYNEEKTLKTVIEKLARKNLSVDREIIVIDDGSTDKSHDVIKEIEKEIPIVAIESDKNRGKTNAIRLGLERASGDYILIQDADLEYSPNDIQKMLDALSEINPVVYGSRNLQRNPRSSLLFFLGGVILTKVTNILYGQKLTDVTTCYKLFPRSILNKPLTTDGFNFCFEITALLANQGIKIIEIPISYNPRTSKLGKKITIIDGFKALITLVKFRLFK